MSLKYHDCIQTSLHRIVWADGIALSMTISSRLIVIPQFAGTNTIDNTR